MQGMVHIRRSDERGHAHHGWLDTRRTFSFGGYYDPRHMHFRSLRVINEDEIAPKAGFGMQPDRDVEIITYVVHGALEHRDNLGHTTTLRADAVQHMSAGEGIVHSEMNPSPAEPLHLLQVWITPDIKGVPPTYAERSLSSAPVNHLSLVASKLGRAGSIPIHQNAQVYLAKCEASHALTHPLTAGHAAWAQIISGEWMVNGKVLRAGDGASIEDEPQVELRATTQSRLLLFDLA